MSSTNLDLPVLMSADQIRRREFVTTRRGYDPEQVRAYLEQVAEQVEAHAVVAAGRPLAGAGARAGERRAEGVGARSRTNSSASVSRA